MLLAILGHQIGMFNLMIPEERCNVWLIKNIVMINEVQCNVYTFDIYATGLICQEEHEFAFWQSISNMNPQKLPTQLIVNLHDAYGHKTE